MAVKVTEDKGLIGAIETFIVVRREWMRIVFANHCKVYVSGFGWIWVPCDEG